MSERQLVFFDRHGAEYQPVRHYNQRTGRSAYRVKPPGASNRTEEFLEFDTIEDLARAMLVDGRPARVKAVVGSGPVSVLRFGADKLVRYELDDALAQRIGIPARSDQGGGTASAALIDLRKRFLTAFPDFESSGTFAAKQGRYWDSYRAKVDALLAAVATHPEDGWAVLKDILTASQGGRGALPPFFEGDVNWRVPRTRDGDPTTFDAALDTLVAGEDDPAAALAQFNVTYWPAVQTIGEPKTYRDTRIVPSAVLAAAHPDRAILVRYTPYVKAERLLNDRTLFKNAPITADEYRAVLALAEQIRAAMIDWGWQPRDLWDVHGFILATCGDKTETEMDDAAVLAKFSGNPLFDKVREQWSDEVVRAFCIVARAAHAAKLDWWFVNPERYYDLRCGRKDASAQRAKSVLISIWGSYPWLTLHGKAPKVFDDALALTHEWQDHLSVALAERFAARIRDAERLAADQDFAPVGRPGYWPNETEPELAPADTEPMPRAASSPTNLILYGPPGTGKTYATARHAVRLCGEATDGLDREALMVKYKTLSEAGRIEFVTFHQSTAYEEFVEGLRPSSVDEEGQPLKTGFRLMPTPGIFRLIARRAEMSTGPSGEAFTLGDRQVFKMSLGDASRGEDAWLFEEAIEKGYIYLGFADIDWSDRRFAERSAILAAAQQHNGLLGGFRNDGHLTLRTGPVASPDRFRNELKIGDVVVVSKGLSLFRAIGVVEGPYEYAPRSGEYSHRRKVRWLWHDDGGISVGEISSKRFNLETIHRLSLENLSVPALERVANSQRDPGSGTPEPFVLVIDEINRANISKVFGELITLLEADKRIGADNELRVRLPYSGDTFGVPANLHIVGTMNTADRSIALIDKALRRRFTFEEMMPDYDVLGMADEVADAGVSLAEVLSTLNDRIEYLIDREHQIGHGWLLGCGTKAKLDAKMRTAVIPLIAEYFFEDWGRTADVLGGRENNPFLDARTLAPPPGMTNEEPRIRWSVRSNFASDAYLRLVGRG